VTVAALDVIALDTLDDNTQIEPILFLLLHLQGSHTTINVLASLSKFGSSFMGDFDTVFFQTLPE
jgi:hypothetical protein